MVPQKDCSGHLSCKNRTVGPPFSRDWCDKRNGYCEYGDCCYFKPILVEMEAFERWLKQEDYENLSDDGGWTEAAWIAAMKEVLKFIEDAPYETENERRILVALKNRIDTELGKSDV